MHLRGVTSSFVGAITANSRSFSHVTLQSFTVGYTNYADGIIKSAQNTCQANDHIALSAVGELSGGDE